MVPNEKLLALFALYESGSQKELLGIPRSRLPIAYIELISVLVGFSVFAKNNKNRMVTL